MTTKLKKIYSVEFEITGQGYIYGVEAESKEEAEEKAYAMFHDGTELEDVEWETGEASAEEE